MAAQQSIKEQLKGKKTYVGGFGLVVYGVLDMLGIAPLDHTFTDGAGDMGAVSAGVGATLAALRASVTTIQDTVIAMRAEVQTLRTDLQALRATSDDEGTA